MKTLKTLTLIAIAVVTLTAVSNQSFAQATDSETVTLTANLNTTLALALAGTGVEFTFDELSEYQNGIGEADEVTLMGSVASTADWKLEYKATAALTHSNGTNTIPLSQVGVRAAITGLYLGAARSLEPAKTDPLALDNVNVVLFNKATGTTNAGSALDNAFGLYWEMGTQNGDMLTNSLFDANYVRGTYTTSVLFTLTEVI